MIITLSTNEAYINHTICFIRSLRTYCDQPNLYIRLVNVSDQSYDKLMNYVRSSDIIIRDNISSLSNKKTLVKPLAETNHNISRGKFSNLLYSEEISYTCHSRFISICEIMSQDHKELLSVDADTIIRGCMKPLFQLIREHDVVTGYYDDIHNNRIFNQEGMLGISNTSHTRQFFEMVRNLIMVKYSDWNIDGDALKSVYEKMKSIINIGQLPTIFKDSSLGEDSIVWSGDGSVKNLSRYRNEHDKYIDI